MRSSNETEDAVSDSLLMLLFDGEDMCPICLQRFEARAQRHQERLLSRIAILKAASCSTEEERTQDAELKYSTGASPTSTASHIVDNSNNIVPSPTETADILDDSWLKEQEGEAGDHQDVLPVEAADTVWAFSALQEACNTIRMKDDDANEEIVVNDGKARELHEDTGETDGPRDWQELLASSGNNEVDLAYTPIMLECGHVYHTHCIREWTELSSSCPVCRCSVEMP